MLFSKKCLFLTFVKDNEQYKKKKHKQKQKQKSKPLYIDAENKGLDKAVNSKAV